MKKKKPWWDEQSFPFIRVPKDLLCNIVSPLATLLYSAMLDRMSLSESNGWLDENGDIYIYYSNESICQLLQCGHDKATKILRELESAGLLRRECHRGSHPDRLYVLPFPFVCGNTADKCAENSQTSMREISTVACGKSAPNNTEKNKTDMNDIYRSISDGYDAMEALVKEQIDYEILSERKDRDRVDEIVSLMADILRGTSPTVRINKDDIPRPLVCRRLRSLGFEHIEYVLDRMRNTATDIRNIRSYLLTTLYNSYDTMNAYYDAQVQHDMQGA